jgi:Family of unknown function (DUF5677)
MSESDWKTFTEENPAFTGLYHKALQLVPKLALETTPPESDDAGLVILQLMLASLPDFDDIMTLSSHNAHWGALKLLRCAFERTVTLKYIAQNPNQAKAFIGFDALDWQRIISGIEKTFGLRMSERAQESLDHAALEARKTFRQEPCERCGLRKQTAWTPHSVKDLARRVEMDYMFFEAYEMPSKFIHPTYFGTQSIVRSPPMYNTLKLTHAILLETIIAHQRYFRGEVSERVMQVVEGFFQVWKFANTHFGFPDRFPLDTREGKNSGPPLFSLPAPSRE